MRALSFTDRGVRLEERRRPEPGRGEVVLDVGMAGVCNTDLEIARGYMGFQGVMGHEFFGRVAAVGPDTELPMALRDVRVVSEINCACGACAACRSGARNHCPTRTVVGIVGRDGGFAEQAVVPVENLHALPESVSDEAAVFVEPLAAALHAFDAAPPPPGARVLVIGDGKLGLLIGLGLAARQGDLGRAVQIGRHRDKLAILDRVGLETALAEDFDELGFDLVIEATGNPGGLAHALRAVRPEGTVVLKSTYAGGAAVDLSPVVVHELRLVGSRCGDFGRAIAALASGRIDPTPLIDEVRSLADGEAAFARASQKGAKKILLRT
jgi:threonine dehydrogenase-like Zn-dependent dehydrogenase